MKALKNRLSYDSKDADKIKTNSKLKMELSFSQSTGNQIECSASGILKFNNKTHNFAVTGNLTAITAPNGDEVYIGGLPGYIDGRDTLDKIIDITMNYNATTNEAFVPITLGAFGDDENLPAMFEFGNIFDGLQEATKTLFDNMDNNSSIVPDHEGVISPMSANTTEYCLSTNYGTYGGKNVIFGSYYGTKEAVPSGSWLGKVRAQVQLNNFISTYNASLQPYDPNYPERIYTSINHKVTDVWLKYSTSVSNNRITDPKPEAFSNSISVKYPSFLIPYGALNYIMSSFWNFNIPVSGVSHTTSGLGYNILETRIWNNSGLSGALTTTSSTPYSETTGVANNFLIFDSVSAGSTCTATTNVRAQIFFSDVRENGTTITRSIIVSSLSSYTTLKSVN